VQICVIGECDLLIIKYCDFCVNLVFFFYIFNYRNELLGLEGMVKIKNPDDNVNGSNAALSVDMKSTSGNESESKRFDICNIFHYYKNCILFGGFFVVWCWW
jgi:hypothetical protein